MKPWGYVYDGAEYCPRCAPEGAVPTWDELDAPTACYTCGEHLDAPLTPRGVSVVLGALREAKACGDRKPWHQEWARDLLRYNLHEEDRLLVEEFVW